MMDGERSFRALLRRVKGFVSARVGTAGDDGEEQLRRMLALFSEAAPAVDVLLYGDSVHERCARDDVDRRSIGRMVSDNLAGRASVAWLSHSAYHAGIYLRLCHVLQALPRRPNALVIPINLRSFSPQWDRNPLHACTEHARTMERWLAPRGMSVGLDLTAEMATSRRDFLDARLVLSDRITRVAALEDVVRSTPKNQADRELRWRQLFMYFQMQPIDPTHRKLELLVRTVKLAAELEVRPALYVTPVNRDGGERWVGPVFNEVVRQNARVVLERLRLANVPQLRAEDWSRSLDAGCFFSDHDPSEHLNARGRAWVAAAIGRLLES